jgi:hypothetical protein
VADDEVAIIRPRESSDPVVSVFRDMFGLFGSDDQPTRKKRRSSGVLVLPDANTGENSAMKRLRMRER